MSQLVDGQSHLCWFQWSEALLEVRKGIQASDILSFCHRCWEQDKINQKRILRLFSGESLPNADLNLRVYGNENLRAHSIGYGE